MKLPEEGGENTSLRAPPPYPNPSRLILMIYGDESIGYHVDDPLRCSQVHFRGLDCFRDSLERDIIKGALYIFKDS